MKPQKPYRDPPPPGGTSGYTLPMMILLAGATAMWIGGLIHFTRGEVRQAYQSFHLYSGLNLAEGAAERAFHAIHNDAWSGWDIESGTMVMEPVIRDLGGNAVGRMEARVEDLAALPRIIATGIVTIPNQPEIRRELLISLEQRTFFRNALTANALRFQGNHTFVDSFDSALGAYDYNENRNDQAIIASMSLDSIEIGNAHILGFVATGGGLPSIGPGGTILGFDSPEGISIDLTRITSDFSASFPQVSAPNTYHGELGTIDRDITLPLEGHWTEEGHFVYQVDSVDLNNRQMTIDGHVVLHVTGNVTIRGNSGLIHLKDGANAILYVDGDLAVGADGILNETKHASELMIYGSAPTAQDFELAGRSDWFAAVYAPNADVRLKRTGSDGVFHGSVVASTITIEGKYDFHYDEALGSFSPAYSPAVGTFRTGQWSEGSRGKGGGKGGGAKK